MKTINVYDFDHTIYAGDSSFDFVLFCIRRQPRLLRYLPSQLLACVKYVLGFSSKTAAKQAIFVFLNSVSDVDEIIKEFWDGREDKIKGWYQGLRQDTDIIISASPEFLVRPMAKKLGVETVMATVVDKKTGKITGENCWGEEKVRRLKAKYPHVRVDACYSDSMSDMPLFAIASRPFVVQGGRVRRLDERRRC